MFGRGREKEQSIEFRRFTVKFIRGQGLQTVDAPIDKNLDPHGLINGITIREMTGPLISGDPEHEKKINYTAIDKKNNIGVTELWGRRPTQEDRVLIGALDESASKLDKKAWQGALRQTISVMQSQVEAQAIKHGSCLCANVVVGNTIHGANLGDSTSYLVIIDKNGRASVELLNKLHRPEGGGRLAGVLAVTHAIGDTEIKGINHEPDITSREVRIPPGGSAFLITACDGLTEASFRTPEQHAERIGEIVAKNRNKEPASIAQELAMGALTDHSNDNISVIVTPIDPTNTTPRLAAVFDGHGDDKVAEHLYTHFSGVLNSQLQSKVVELPDVKAVTTADTSKYATQFPMPDQIQTLIQDLDDKFMALARARREGIDFSMHVPEDLEKKIGIRTDVVYKDVEAIRARKENLQEALAAYNTSKSPETAAELTSVFRKAKTMSESLNWTIKSHNSLPERLKQQQEQSELLAKINVDTRFTKLASDLNKAFWKLFDADQSGIEFTIPSPKGITLPKYVKNPSLEVVKIIEDNLKKAYTSYQENPNPKSALQYNAAYEQAAQLNEKLLKLILEEIEPKLTYKSGMHK